MAYSSSIKTINFLNLTINDVFFILDLNYKNKYFKVIIKF